MEMTVVTFRTWFVSARFTNLVRTCEEAFGTSYERHSLCTSFTKL